MQPSASQKQLAMQQQQMAYASAAPSMHGPPLPGMQQQLQHQQQRPVMPHGMHQQQNPPNMHAMMGGQQPMYGQQAMPGQQPPMPAPQPPMPPMAAQQPPMPFPQMQQQPAPGQQAAVEKMIIGEWGVYEDNVGIFYMHMPTGQQYEAPPPALMASYHSYRVEQDQAHQEQLRQIELEKQRIDERLYHQTQALQQRYSMGGM
jgi:hypothetical protein